MNKKFFKYFLEKLSKTKGSFILLLLSSITTNLIWIIIPYFYKQILDIISSPNLDKALISGNLYMLFGYILITSLIAFVARRTIDLVSPKYYVNIYSGAIKDCFEYVQKHSYRFFTNNFVGSIVKKINRFADSIIYITDIILYDVMKFLISSILIFSIMFLQNKILGLVFFSWMIVFLLLTYMTYKRHVLYQQKAIEQETAVSGFIADTIGNNFNIAIFSSLKRELINLKNLMNSLIKAEIDLGKVRAIGYATLSAFNVFIELLILYLGIKFWLNGTISPGVFVLLITYQGYLTNQLFGIPHITRKFQQQLGHAKEMMEILDMKHEIQDLPGAQNIIVNNGKIEFKNVNFSYNENAKVYENFNLTINPGEKIALVGSSGGGKSTIMKLLFRFFDIQGGSILIDNQDISKVTQESLRKNISLVPQEPILFHRSIFENIAYGNPDADKKLVFESSKLAHCDEFIQKLRNKYETYVGERGIKLSGGEKQRVAIARALLENSKILILDEATSSLDSQSEQLIQKAIDNAMVGRTTIVIAHRLSTIMKMDRIIVLEDGKIIEEGTHTQLINKENGKYKKLWEIQSGGFIE